MEPVSIHEAKTQFSRLVARAQAGEEIVVRRGATPVAKIVKYTLQRRRGSPAP
jgi:prevent-host-death family protein